MTWTRPERPKYGPEFFRNRAIVRRRSGGICELPDCSHPAVNVDHVVPVAEGGSDALENLQDLCECHHKRKTQEEAARGRMRRSGKRQPRRHPGRVS